MWYKVSFHFKNHKLYNIFLFSSLLYKTSFVPTFSSLSLKKLVFFSYKETSLLSFAQSTLVFFSFSSTCLLLPCLVLIWAISFSFRKTQDMDILIYFFVPFQSKRINAWGDNVTCSKHRLTAMQFNTVKIFTSSLCSASLLNKLSYNLCYTTDGWCSGMVMVVTKFFQV